MHPVEMTFATVIDSFSSNLPTTTLETNWIVPSADNSDCAANENDMKLKILPTTKRPVPNNHDCKKKMSVSFSTTYLWLPGNEPRHSGTYPLLIDLWLSFC